MMSAECGVDTIGNTLLREMNNRMTKIVINACYGGFGLSNEATRMYLDMKGYKYTESDYKGLYTNFDVDGLQHFYVDEIERDDPVLVEVVEKLGDRANGRFSKLAIEELPRGTMYRIQEYDGNESIQTKENTDWKVAR